MRSSQSHNLSNLHCQLWGLMFTEFKGCTINAFLIRARLLLLFECTSGLHQRRHAGIVLLLSRYTWLKPPFTTNYSEWICMCLPFQASHWSAVTHRPPPIRNVLVSENEGNLPVRSRNNEGMQSHPMSQNTEQHYSVESFSKSVCPDIFVLKVTKLWVWAHCCVYVAYIADGE